MWNAQYRQRSVSLCPFRMSLPTGGASSIHEWTDIGHRNGRSWSKQRHLRGLLQILSTSARRYQCHFLVDDGDGRSRSDSHRITIHDQAWFRSSLLCGDGSLNICFELLCLFLARRLSVRYFDYYFDCPTWQVSFFCRYACILKKRNDLHSTSLFLLFAISRDTN